MNNLKIGLSKIEMLELVGIYISGKFFFVNSYNKVVVVVWEALVDYTESKLDWKFEVQFFMICSEYTTVLVV